MEREKVKYGLRTYDYYQENGHNVLEHTNEKGFFTRLNFRECDKTKEEIDKELIELIFKKR